MAQPWILHTLSIWGSQHPFQEYDSAQKCWWRKPFSWLQRFMFLPHSRVNFTQIVHLSLWESHASQSTIHSSNLCWLLSMPGSFHQCPGSQLLLVLHGPLLATATSLPSLAHTEPASPHSVQCPANEVPPVAYSLNASFLPWFALVPCFPRVPPASFSSEMLSFQSTSPSGILCL